MLYFRLQPCNFSFTNIFKAVNHIRGTLVFRITLKIWCKVHKITSEVYRHIVLNTVMEYTYACICIFIFTLQAHVEIDRFFWFQIRIASPIPTEFCYPNPYRVRSIHFPVIPQFAHTRFCITSTYIGFKSAMCITVNVICHTQGCRYVRTKQATIIKTHNWRQC